MKHLKFSLIDNDYSVSSKTDLNFEDNMNDAFAKFLKDVEEELETGATAYLEIEGPSQHPVTFTISNVE